MVSQPPTATLFPYTTLFRSPLVGGLVFRLAIDAFGVENRQVMHGACVAPLGRREIEPARRVGVLLHAMALLVEAAQPVLRRRQSPVGGALEPLRRFDEVLRNATPFGIAQRDLVFGGCIAGQGGGAQAGAADGGRQAVGGRRRRGRVPLLRARAGGVAGIGRRGISRRGIGRRRIVRRWRRVLAWRRRRPEQVRHRGGRQQLAVGNRRARRLGRRVDGGDGELARRRGVRVRRRFDRWAPRGAEHGQGDVGGADHQNSGGHAEQQRALELAAAIVGHRRRRLVIGALRLAGLGGGGLRGAPRRGDEVGLLVGLRRAQYARRARPVCGLQRRQRGLRGGNALGRRRRPSARHD